MSVARTPDSANATHPLDPLSGPELELAVRVATEETETRLAQGNAVVSRVRQVEASKQDVLAVDAGTMKPQAVARLALVMMMSHEGAIEVRVHLNAEPARAVAWSLKPGQNAPMTGEEYVLCSKLVKEDPRILAILRDAGVQDPRNALRVDAWTSSVNKFGKRNARPLCFLKTRLAPNFYACPVDGFDIVLDLHERRITSVTKLWRTRLPPPDPMSSFMDKERVSLKDGASLKPLHVVQPQGPSFRLEGRKLTWLQWSLRVGWTQTEGLVLQTVRFDDRLILWRAALAEMVVPYGDPRHPNYNKNAFDVGEDGVGHQSNSLKLGCDCLGDITYLDACYAASDGSVVTIENAICIHEEDYGLLWKHTDWRTGATRSTRSRRLVISFFTTVANYDYGMYWYLYRDGTIEFETKLTGVLSVSSCTDEQEALGADIKHGTLLAPRLYAPVHQHFFNIRMDMAVDGINHNTVYEVNVDPSPVDPVRNPFRAAFDASTRLLSSELTAQRSLDPARSRFWRVVNTQKKNRSGHPTAYRLVPGGNAVRMAHPSSVISRRAGFLAHHLWVTQYRPGELTPAGRYMMCSSEPQGLPKWTRRDAPLVDTNVVLWYTVGVTHIPRCEDWPVMPCEYAGFKLAAENFFDVNPTLVHSQAPRVQHPRASL